MLVGEIYDELFHWGHSVAAFHIILVCMCVYVLFQASYLQKEQYILTPCGVKYITYMNILMNAKTYTKKKHM